MTIPQPDTEVRGTVVTVTTNSDASNGNTASWLSLVANPGPDGVALREALEVTNSSPGEYSVRFAPQLAGANIGVGGSHSPELPPLTGGSVFINGDIDSDGRPDVTLNSLRPVEACCQSFGLRISSSGNRLHALSLQNFTTGVFFQPLSTSATYSNNEVSASTFRVHSAGITQNSGVDGSGASQPTQNRWANTRLLGNTIESKGDGISFFLYHAIGDVVEQLVIADNAIRNVESGGRGIGLAIGGLAGSRQNRASDVLIANNSIEGLSLAAIGISSGELGSSANTVERLRISGNRLRIDSPVVADGSSRQAIGLGAGDGATDHNNPGTSPIVYPENNVMRNVEVIGNTLTGRGGLPIFLQGGCCGGARNSITDVRIAGNTTRGTSPGMPSIFIAGAGSGGYYSRASTENEISDVSVEENSITLVTEEQPAQFFAGLLSTAGVSVTGGLAAASGNVEDVRIEKNCVDTDFVGISLVGGFGDPNFPAALNEVSQIEVRANVVTRPPAAIGSFFPQAKAISLVGGIENATGNSVRCVVVAENVVAGVPDALSTVDNVGTGASGNVATTGGC